MHRSRVPLILGCSRYLCITIFANHIGAQYTEFIFHGQEIKKRVGFYYINKMLNWASTQKTQIRKFWSSFRYRKSASFLYVRPSANPNRKFFMINSQITNLEFLQNIAQLCLKTVLKVVFLHDFLLCTDFNWSFICYICKEKGYEFADLRKSKSLNHKSIGSGNRKNPRSVTFSGWPANLTNYISQQIADLRFV